MSYGANTLDLYRQLGLYAGRIVSGAKPALPRCGEQSAWLGM